MSFNRLGTIFHKCLGRTAFSAFHPTFHASHNSSRSSQSPQHSAQNPQQPPKRLFHASAVQIGLPEWRNQYNNVLTTPSCSRHLQETLRSFRASNDAAPCDVTLCIEGAEKTKAKMFKAHKLILGLFSKRFREFWSSNVQYNPDGPESIIRFSGVEPSAFAIMLRYMYADDTSSLTMENAMDLLFCANFFEADRLTQICRDFIEINLAAGNACHAFQRARLMSEERMAQLALSVICRSPDVAFASPEFLDLLPSDLKVILVRDDLNMPEPLIYEHAGRWALNRTCQQPDTCGKNLRDTIGDLRFAIRFALFDKELLASGPLKDGVITKHELNESVSFATTASDPSPRFPSTPRLPAPAPFYISCQICCDAFGKDKEEWSEWVDECVIIELRPEFAPQTCAYARKVIELANTSYKWCNVRLVPCDGFFIDCGMIEMTLEPPESSVAQETSILSRTVPGAVCFGWEGNHCIPSQERFRRLTGEPEYAIWLASEKPNGGAVFGRIVHGLERLKSAHGHFVAGKVTGSYITYWTKDWDLHDSFPLE